MSDKKQELSFEGELGTEQVAAYFDKIASGIRSGELPIEAGAERIHLAVGGPIHLEVTAKVKKRGCKLKIEVEWDRLPDAGLHIGRDG